jgi:hypothetical protein
MDGAPFYRCEVMGDKDENPHPGADNERFALIVCARMGHPELIVCTRMGHPGNGAPKGAPLAKRC